MANINRYNPQKQKLFGSSIIVKGVKDPKV